MQNSDSTAIGIPFPPGVSGNPNGRPKGTKNRSTVLRELLALSIDGQTLDGKDGKLTVEQAVINGLVRKAIAGDVAAVKEVLDTNYGKLTETQVQLQATQELNEAGAAALKHFIKNNPNFGGE